MHVFGLYNRGQSYEDEREEILQRMEISKTMLDIEFDEIKIIERESRANLVLKCPWHYACEASYANKDLVFDLLGIL